MSNNIKTITSYISEAVYTVTSIVKGHVITLRNLFRKKVTLQYPEVRWDLPDGYRGLPCLPVDLETGQDRCIGCGACARACPTQVITVSAHMGEDKKRVVDSFVLNAGGCMFCGLCAEACPVKALQLSKEYELATFTREGAIYDRARLNEVGQTIEPKPAQEKEVA